MSYSVKESDLEQAILASRSVPPGGDHYRAYVGPPDRYDFMGATQFRLLTSLGLQEEHRLLDVGCGSLRAGRYFIQYLMPDRYVGVDPNGWLWRGALETEVGEDILELKRPRLIESGDFALPEIASQSVDCAVAQSIYSHAGADLLASSTSAVARVLKPTGQFLFTAITPEDLNAEQMVRGAAHEGWSYPECLVYSEGEILEAIDKTEMTGQKLPWYHPRQTWFRATPDPALQLTAKMIGELGSGRPLFDERFRA